MRQSNAELNKKAGLTNRLVNPAFFIGIHHPYSSYKNLANPPKGISHTLST